MVKKRRGAPEGNQNARKHGFYSHALSAAEQLEIEQAADMPGLDDEIIILRMKLKKLLEDSPDRIDLHIAAANSIARLVKVRYEISKEQKKSLKDAIAKVLTEVAAPLGVGVGMGAGMKLGK